MRIYLFWVALVLSIPLGAAPVKITLTRPTAENVLFASEFNGWQPLPMKKDGNGQWAIELELAPGEYGYKFIVDEEWIFDPRHNAQKIVNGTANSMLEVPREKKAAAKTKAPTQPEPIAEAPLTEVRDWKDSISGRTIQARLVAIEGRTATLEINGQHYPIRMERLRPSDQNYIESMRDLLSSTIATLKPEATASANTPPDASGFDAGLTPKRKHQFTMPMQYKVRYLFRPRSFDPKRTPEDMRIAIALPENFDPSRGDNRIAIINQTADADASNVMIMDQYYRPVTDAGWICIAVDIDGEEPKRKSWNGIHDRWILVYSALQEMHKAWPTSKEWEYATFGFSGGAGYANYIGAQLVEERYDLIGIWAGGSNWKDHHFKDVLKPKAGFYRAYYYMSVASNDDIVSEQMRDEGKQWGEDNFRKFRYATYDAGHTICQPHIEAALIWFGEQ